MPTTLDLNNASMCIKDAFLYCFYWGDAEESCVFHDFIMAQLHDGQEKELREAVQKILEHDKMVVLPNEFDILES